MVHNDYKILWVCLGIAFIIPLQSSHGQSQSILPLPAKKPHAEVILSDIPTPDKKPDINVFTIYPAEETVNVTSEDEAENISQDSLSPIERITSDKQARLARQIFELQQAGRVDEADSLIQNLKSNSLMGHILAQRYLRPEIYKVSFDELKNWLELYADHPQAQKIYALSKESFPKEAQILLLPNKQKQISGNIVGKSQRGIKYQTSKRRNEDQQRRVEKLVREIKSKARQSQASLSLNILNNDYASQFLDTIEYDELRSLIAASYFYALKKEDAYNLAFASYQRSGDSVPLAGWIKGLIDWEEGRYESAAQSFEVASSSRYASGWLSSAAAFWAARSYKKLGNDEKMKSSLSSAAAYPRTFYGLVATRALGNDVHFNWKIPSLSREDIKKIESTAKGRRASLLIQAGQIALAEEELKTLPVNESTGLKQSLLAYANHYKLPAVMMLIGNSMLAERGNYFDAALYPHVEWITQVNFDLDSALINAFVRQESRFNQFANNPSGATGLMQLMPSTANYVDGSDLYDTQAGRYILQNPDKNLDIGQRYIQELLKHPDVDNNLMYLAIAYNAGPGNLSKWKREQQTIKDPLFFIETIPFTETRAFVERIMTNYWIYKMRAGEKTPTLDALASGQSAQFASN